MKKLLSFLILITLFSCSSSDDDQSPTEEYFPEFVNPNAIIELPTNAAFSTDELFLSSLFTENAEIVDGRSSIKSFEENSMELVFVTNEQDKIVMLSYFDISSTNEIIVNAESTAIGLILLHPWTFDLSVYAKKEAIEYIKSLPEFEEYKNAVAKSIAENELAPLENNTILQKVMDVQNIVFERYSIYVEPLQVHAEDTSVSIHNSKSSASYSIGLYDKNDNQVQQQLLKGLDKSYTIFQDFKDGPIDESAYEEQEITFNLPSDGNWTFRAKSGLSFDGSPENLEAGIFNTKTLMANVLGIFSSQLKDIILQGDCYITLAERIYNGTSGTVNIQESMAAFSNGEISGYEFTNDIIFYAASVTDDLLTLIADCSFGEEGAKGIENIKPGTFGKILNFINLISKTGNAFNGSAMLTDWLQFDKDIEFCIIKENDIIADCVLEGHWEGTMEMTNQTVLQECEDVNGDGTPICADYCQACNWGLFGSFYNGSEATLHFGYSEEYIENNFKMTILRGGNTMWYETICYTGAITKDQSFCLGLNLMANGDEGWYLGDFCFEILENSTFAMSGTWGGEISYGEEQCLEACSGTWSVNWSNTPLPDGCDRIPLDP